MRKLFWLGLLITLSALAWQYWQNKGRFAQESPFSEEYPHEKKYLTIQDKKLAYIEIETTSPQKIIFLHGNPTSSYIWRNVMISLARRSVGHLIAPDLIGMGDSNKLEVNEEGPSYAYEVHRRYLHAFLDLFVTPGEKVLLVMHDWGAVLGLDWASKNQQRVLGLVYMEAILGPLETENMDLLPRLKFSLLRAESFPFIQVSKFLQFQVLPNSILRKLTEKEFNEYRRPFQTEESLRGLPLWMWPRELPIDGTPEDVARVAKENSLWLKNSSDIPKLLILGNPGLIMKKGSKDFDYALNLPNQTVETVRGLHFLQEDSPDEIGSHIAHFIVAHIPSKASRKV